ncbi:MAG: hypothetical protein AAGD38_01385 [Acidobacteriota bacterium]
MAILVDLPDATVPDNPEWRARRALAAEWAQMLATDSTLGMETTLVLYRNARANNADLPASAWLWEVTSPLPISAEAVEAAPAVPFEEVLSTHSILLAPTEFSTTAPLKVAARRLGFRAATMAGFSLEMVPALRLDFTDVDRRVRALASRLEVAEAAHFVFQVDATEYKLTLDLRFRAPHVSSGLLHEPGTAGNVPSGETYIVPYEGEGKEPSRTAGLLPVQLEGESEGPNGEIVIYRIEANTAVAVASTGPVSTQEAERLAAEPAYGNMAELGLGVLGVYGLEPIGEVMLDEKLGLHIAFGRSEHFGGITGPDRFSRPEAVVHIDRVYLPQLQPKVQVVAVDLELPSGEREALMRDGAYV